MPVDSPPLALPPRLEEVLQSLPDGGWAGRLRRVYVAAGHALGRLSDVDLLRYEAVGGQPSPDLSLWEEMAPVIRDTVMDVNTLLNEVRACFPEPDAPGPQREQRTVAALWSVTMQLAHGVTQLGEAMRNPAVVSDRWTLLEELQRLRGRFREQAGSLVYESVRALGPVARSQVVPGFEQEVRGAVAVRALVADLVRVVQARGRKVDEAEPEDVQWHAQQLQGELDAFGRTAAYRGLRAQDKRRIIEARVEVSRLALQPNPSHAELREGVRRLEAFARSLSAVNQRQVLVQHDREVRAACGVRLEQALGRLGQDEASAARALAEVGSAAQALYGREARLDGLLRRARRLPLARLRGAALRTHLEDFLQGLAQLEGM